ncbi:MAG: M23 family metallopeptidase [Cytophagales bacterium]|jgi:murein DD-endopeptidase MepM/ murein hydrolase activator NlpD|nr:M23 family metallopeptidase [Cytophagales bacterium]
MRRLLLRRLQRGFLLCFVSLPLALAGCGKTTPIRDVFRKQTAYEKYQQALKDTRLDQTALGRDWLLAGQRALRDSVLMPVPFRETAYFAADKPTAYGFRFHARRGERISVQLTVQAAQPVRMFVDVFAWDGTPKPLISSDSTGTLTFDVDEDRTHLVRVQPELLRSGRYTLTVASGPSLGFPVRGKTDKDIGSFWGAVRDGGQRRHEGIDIFAPRGTPAVASVGGTVREVNTNNLGGKVVWLRDDARNQVLYYAHLDTQLVQPGQRVSLGDTLGLVGTTGNARFTAPHLHFGIYRWLTGAIDPYPFVKSPAGPPPAVQVPLENLGRWHRISVKKAELRALPSDKSPASDLERHTPLLVLGGNADWFRVQLPTGEQGYVAARKTELVRLPVRRVKLPSDTPVTDQPLSAAPIVETLPGGTSVSTLARFGNYWLVETARFGLGWIEAGD